MSDVAYLRISRSEFLDEVIRRRQDIQDMQRSFGDKSIGLAVANGRLADLFHSEAERVNDPSIQQLYLQCAKQYELVAQFWSKQKPAPFVAEQERPEGLYLVVNS